MFKQILFTTLLLATSSMAVPTGPNQCEICEFVVSSSRNFLEANHTTRELQTFFNYTCDLFGIYTPICRGAVASFVPKLIYALEDTELTYYTAQEVCVELKICQDYDVVISPFIIDCDDSDFYNTDYCASFRTTEDKQKATPAPFSTKNLFADADDLELDFGEF